MTGVNHIDTAASYGDSELRVAPRPKPHREDSFRHQDWQATLPRRQGGDPSLARSTWRRHCRPDPTEQPRRRDRVGFALRDGGPSRRRRGAGRVPRPLHRVTGHGLSVAATHRRSLERFAFDPMLLPYSFRQLQDARCDAAERIRDRPDVRCSSLTARIPSEKSDSSQSSQRTGRGVTQPK